MLGAALGNVNISTPNNKATDIHWKLCSRELVDHESIFFRMVGSNISNR
jgi:hypothetical protein